MSKTLPSITSKLITEPAADPYEFDLLVEHVRVTDEEDRKLLDRYAKTARSLIERWIGRALVYQTWEAAWDGEIDCEFIELPMAPVSSIVSVKSYSPTGLESTVAVSVYSVDQEQGRLWLKDGQSWPSDLRPWRSLVINYVAGFSNSPSGVPEQIKHAIFLLAEHYWENRGIVGETVGERAQIPLGISADLMQWNRNVV